MRRLILALALAASLLAAGLVTVSAGTGTEKFADPCGNTPGCWVTPGTPIATAYA